MNKLANTLLLALMLLLSQTAIALHEVQCLDEDHVASCQVCSAHEHSACKTTSYNKLEAINYELSPIAYSCPISKSDYQSCYLSRAPPKHL